MPLVTSTFSPAWLWRNKHYPTIAHSALRLVSPNYTRKRFTTADDDFFDVDWKTNQHEHLVVILHGLESNSHRNYVVGLANFLAENKLDVAAINFRGCSGETNKKLISYHSGFTNDLHEFYQHIKNQYAKISFIGFSLGGNVLLNFLAETQTTAIHKAIAISTPIHLASCATELDDAKNYIYCRRFLKKLTHKAIEKTNLFACSFTQEELKNCHTFAQFDELYTAPVNGFKSATDYWENCSSLYTLNQITTPTLLLNAQDDPFLSEQCYPYAFAQQAENFYLETPRFGGHVGFISTSPWEKQYWHEKRCLEFIQS